MSQKTAAKLSPSTLFSLDIKNVNKIFPGFQLGDFALLYGLRSVQSIVTQLSIKAQLPIQLGGLASNVVFIDGGNSFRLYQTTRFARMFQLEPKQVLDRIYLSRAFTAYQMTALILQKLGLAVKLYNAKLSIISNIAAMFVDNDVEEEEAQQIYSHINNYLAIFAKESQTIVVATYPPQINSSRNSYFQKITKEKSNVILDLKQTNHTREIILEKHSTFKPCSIGLPLKTLPLTAFVGA